LSVLVTGASGFEAFIEVNAVGTLNILKAYRLYGHLIHFSTAHVYGKQTDFPITEDATPNPVDPYSVSKLAGERLVKVFGDKLGLEYVILRPFNTFGPFQREAFLIPSLIRRAITERRVYIYGDSVRDYMYVTDLCRAVELIIDRATVGLFNVCTGISHRVSEIATTVAKIIGIDTGVEVRPREQERPTDISVLVGSYERFKRATGWEPKYALKDGLKETIGWFLKSKVGGA